MLKNHIYSGKYPGCHIQGIAVDEARQHIYFSVTTMLVKTDMDGNVLGTVTGLCGHLGCIAYHEGHIYGSLEYKHDSIGRNIAKQFPENSQSEEDGFYVAIFDPDKIDRMGVNATDNPEVMTTVYLKEVFTDYSAPGHRYGCSGIDGLTFAPEIGARGEKKYLYVAYGVYGDTTRTDNDNQVILQYDIAQWEQYKKPLSQQKLHKSGPDQPDGKYFLFTGNTTYGVQNMEFDPFTNGILLTVYQGKKEAYPNYSLFMIDMDQKPQWRNPEGLEAERGMCLSLKPLGERDERTGIYGWYFPYGATGLQALGDGYYYISHDTSSPEGYDSTATLYRWDGVHPFTEVDAKETEAVVL